jgi:hypothetical protein
MIDLAAAPENVTGGDTAERGAGFGLQSPHASQHRLFMRQAQYGPTSPFIDVVAIWGAPGPTDFDFSTGTFYLTGASSQRNRQAPYTLVTSNTGPWANTHAFVQGDGDTSDDRRLFLMTDDDGSFVTIFGWETSGNNRNDTFIIGYLGTDVQHPGDEEWALFARWENWYPSAWRGSVDFDYENYRFTYAGTVIDPNGQAVDAEWLQYGIGGSTASIITQSNAGPNPWSGEEWLHNPIVSRDRFGASGVPSERDADIGVYQGRQNMVNLSTFDSDGYIHFQNGLVWEWPGVTVLP